MNREIKFRAWEKHAKRMAEITTFKWQSDHLYHQIYTRAIVNEKMIDEWYAYDFGSNSNGIILMQYTGLKDKNGKEIYEGDIIQVPLNIKEYFNCEVKFNDGCFDVVQGNFRDYLKVYIANRCVKVIGNIHENRELMEVEND